MIDFTQAVFKPKIAPHESGGLVKQAPCCQFGIKDFGAIFLITLGAFYPIVVNTTQGARDVDKNLVRAALMMGAGSGQLLADWISDRKPAIDTEGLSIGRYA